MFFVGGIGIFHIKEQLARQLTAFTAALETFFIAGAIIHRAHLRRHHLLCPESRTFYTNAPGTGAVIKFTLIANQSTGR